MVGQFIVAAGRFGWPFLITAINVWSSSIAPDFPSGSDGILVPNWSLGTMHDTVMAHYAMVADAHPTQPNTHLFNRLALYGIQPVTGDLSLGWSIVNPQDNPGADPTVVRTSKNPAGLEMLALLAFQPDWVNECFRFDQADGASPRYWLPGLMADPFVPFVSRNIAGEIRFGADRPRELHVASYSPTVRKLF